MTQEWTVQQVARVAGVTSRTLRHYDAIGLLVPSRVAANGYRHYDTAALVRLQRILLLRELGLALPRIAEVLARPESADDALERHLAWLRAEQDRTASRIRSLERTIRGIREGEELMVETMFDGFDHTQHRAEVEERWGTTAYARGDDWWRSLDDAGRRDLQAEVAALNARWTDAAARGVRADSAEAQRLASHHVAWLESVPGAVGAEGSGESARAARDAYLLGLGDLYVADPRFAANYGGSGGATLVRDALRAYVEAGR